MTISMASPSLSRHSLRVWAYTLVWGALLLNPFVSNILAVDAVSDSSSQLLMQEPERPPGVQVEESPFTIVIDGGSTGSRLHIFEFVQQAYSTTDHESSSSAATSLECVRRGSARANYPLSAFGRTDRTLTLNATAVAQHLLPVFVYAAQQIPARYHATTTVYYQATAGMRLLDESEQEAVYDALYAGLMESPEFVFTSFQRSHIATLSGEDEGFYGVVAANFLKGTIDVHLQMIPTTTTSSRTTTKNSPLLLDEQHQRDHDFLEASAAAAQQNDHAHYHHGPIGALDMGGSSTQIVFLPGHRHRAQERSEHRSCRAPRVDLVVGAADTGDADSSTATTADETTCHAATPEEMPLRLNGQDFFATSYLSYGVDQFRERLWTTWVNEHKAQVQAEHCCDAMVLENPCTFKGYEIEWEGYTLVGTGDAHKCVQEVQRLIPHPEEPDHDDYSLGSHVGGVEHPPVRGKFFAMSLYFFTLDSLRELSHPDKEAYEALNLSWPTPSIAELYNALDGLCSRSWEGDLEDIQHHAHAFTRAEVLPHRCLESVYMVTLLRDGYGFASESRDITFTFLVDGSEVEWTLGMVLSFHAEKRDSMLQSEPQQPQEAPVSAPSYLNGVDSPTKDDGSSGNNATTLKQDELSAVPTSSPNRLLNALSEHLLSYVSM